MWASRPRPMIGFLGPPILNRKAGAIRRRRKRTVWGLLEEEIFPQARRSDYFGLFAGGGEILR